MSHPLDDHDWQPAYAWVELKARGLLDRMPAGDSVSTAELADMVMTFVERGPQDEVRKKRIFKALAALTTRNLQRYNTIGEPTLKMAGGRMARPKRWHCPGAEIILPLKPICSKCKRLL